MFKPLALAAGALLVLSACGSASREAAPAAAGARPSTA